MAETRRQLKEIASTGEECLELRQQLEAKKKKDFDILRKHNESIVSIRKERQLEVDSLQAEIESFATRAASVAEQHRLEVLLLREGKLLLIYICNFHVLNHLLLIYICKLHWNMKRVYLFTRYSRSRF